MFGTQRFQYILRSNILSGLGFLGFIHNLHSVKQNITDLLG